MDYFFFFKQKTAYEMRISDWSSDVCSSDLGRNRIYHTRDRTRLKLALRGKRLGLQLAEICSLIDMYDGPGDTEAQLRHYLDVLAQHKAILERQRQDLEQTLSEIRAQKSH